MTDSNNYAAAETIISRLLQMRRLWDDAATAYFDPDKFQLALQNCVVVARTVSFVLQAHKNTIHDFDAWYAQHQESWRTDTIMTWAKEARNSIEKRGDLETNSQVRATIVAGYMEGPETEWVAQALFSSPYEIFRSVPEKYRIPHIIENGTLLIERRWVDRELPQMEVLEALAYVYRRLADMVVSLLEHLKIPIPPVIANRQPASMRALAMDRAVYLSMKDGSRFGLRYFEKEASASDAEAKKLTARYGEWKRLKEARTFDEIGQALFERARVVMSRDGYHQRFTFLFKGHVPVRLINVEVPDRAAKYVIARDLAGLARIEGADGVMTIGEAWTAEAKDAPKSGFASDARNRGEALMMQGANSNGEFFTFTAAIERRRLRRKKVKHIGKTELNTDSFPFMLYPLMKQWGCVDETKLSQALDDIDEFGIETPKLAGQGLKNAGSKDG